MRVPMSEHMSCQDMDSLLRWHSSPQLLSRPRATVARQKEALRLLYDHAPSQIEEATKAVRGHISSARNCCDSPLLEASVMVCGWARPSCVP